MSTRMTSDRRGPRGEKKARLPGAPCSSPRVRSADLLQGARELIIEHAGEEYRLRVTAQGKLILTK